MRSEQLKGRLGLPGEYEKAWQGAWMLVRP
jgi:hypothetical protein